MSKKIRFSFILIFLSIGLYAQDYYPLELGNTWEYEYYENGILDPDEAFKLEIISSEIIDEKNVYEIEQSRESEDRDTIFFVEELSTPNDIFLAESLEQIRSENYMILFKHSYVENEILETEEGTFEAQFHGKYVTAKNEQFDDCWVLIDEEEMVKYYLAPDVGMIAFEILFFGDVDLIEISNYKISTTSNVELDSKVYDITISPNPSSDFININGIENVKNARVHIYNQQGALINMDLIDGQGGQYDISQLSNGMFIVTISTSNGIIYSQEIIKY